MAKTKISEFSSTPANNTDIDSINLAEGCAPSGINDAIRELMSQLKDWQSGASNDPYVVGSSGSLTLNQGTANGVLYLNGSKVATSGSALVFDGTNLGIGTNSPSQVLDVFANSASIAAFRSTGGSSNDKRLLITSGGDNIRLDSANQSGGAASMAFSIGSTEGMRLTSTGLGIGTSSPALKLHVVSSSGAVSYFETSDTATGPYAIWRNGTTSIGDVGSNKGISGSGNATDFMIASRSTYPLLFGTGSAERMRLDSSGNLGLGVTPTGQSKFQTYTSGSYINGVQVQYNASNVPIVLACDNANGDGYIGCNTVQGFSSTQNYAITNSATKLRMEGGAFKFYNAPSGTAGNAITFTQAMSLDANGRLNVGATSFGFAVKAGFRGDSSSVPTVEIQNESATGKMLTFRTNGESEVGSISFTASATTYNTSSDYRLKNITGPITNSGAYIDSLNPVEGTWKADGSTFVGLIAHEVQEASRTQVATGTKDGVEMQSMDYSNPELIANLIAEVKSLRQRVATLEAK